MRPDGHFVSAKQVGLSGLSPPETAVLSSFIRRLFCPDRQGPGARSERPGPCLSISYHHERLQLKQILLFANSIALSHSTRTLLFGQGVDKSNICPLCRLTHSL